MPSHKVLLVEDDPEIARIISGYLAGEGFEVIWCQSAQEAREHPSADFDAVLLDIMLGDGSGLDVCAQIRAGGDCPIIFVSCLDDPETMVTALELGGDDYIVKPFDKRVLAARLKANLRRVKGLQHEENQRSACSFKGFSLDISTRTVKTSSGRTSRLTPLEHQLLSFFINNPNEFFSTSRLYEQIWGKDSCGDTRTVIVLVHTLRKKIEGNPSEPRYLVNARGWGYAFRPDDCEANL